MAHYDIVQTGAHLAQESQLAAENGPRQLPMEPTAELQRQPEGKFAELPATTEVCKFIFCSGMPRSASTWSFNICRRLLAEMRPGERHSAGYTPDVGNKAEELECQYDHIVLKCHRLDPRARELCAAGRAAAVYTHRDPYDAIYSSMVMFHQPFDAALESIRNSLELLEFHRRQGRSLILHYEAIRTSPTETIRAIATFLGLDAPAELVERLARETSPEAMKAIAQTVSEESGGVRTPRSIYDPVTCIHRDHIRDGRSGHGRAMLTEEQRRRVMELVEKEANSQEGRGLRIEDCRLPIADCRGGARQPRAARGSSTIVDERASQSSINRQASIFQTPRPPRKYYSQGGEDCLLWALFDKQEEGFFLDVGAFDGIHLSNTFSFEQQGWTGICVEAHPVYAQQCRKNRPGSTCLYAACVAVDGNGRVPFLMEPLGLLSGARANETDDLEGRYAQRGMKFPGFAKVSVPARTLNSILSEYLPAGTSIDFLSVDVEGTELDVLCGLDLDRFPIRVIVAEANTPEASKELTSYLVDRGYSQARSIGNNLFFARDPDDVSWLAYARVVCETEKTVHPLGESCTLPSHIGQAVRHIPSKLSENVQEQTIGQPLCELLAPALKLAAESANGTHHYRFAHIVNTYACPSGSNGDLTQKTTFAAMTAARNFTAGKAEVEFISVHEARDADSVPDFFRKAAVLTRTAPDLHRFQVARPLPLLFDILERGIAAADGADFIIFTNADICPMPHFYRAVSELLDLGFDCLTINRRTTGKLPMDPRWSDLLPCDYGAPHAGFDCFVFPIALSRRFVRSDSCVGAGSVMRTLLYDLVAFSQNMLMLTDVHLTYHVGDDQDWNRPEIDDYRIYNMENGITALNTLVQDPIARRKLRSFCTNHQEYLSQQPGSPFRK